MSLNAYLDRLSPDIAVAMELNKTLAFKVSVNSSGVLTMGSSSPVRNSALSDNTVSLVLLHMSDTM
jgi:hypothetical protein